MLDVIHIRQKDREALDNLEIAAFDIRDLCATLIHEVMAQEPVCQCDAFDEARAAAVDAAYDMLTRFQELCQEIADTVGDVREVTDA